MESLFFSLKTERTARKTYRTRNQAKASVLLAQAAVNRTGCRPPAAYELKRPRPFIPIFYHQGVRQSRAEIIIFNPHDVIFAEIAACLDFN